MTNDEFVAGLDESIRLHGYAKAPAVFPWPSEPSGGGEG
jgi:hypothetical protein